MQTLKYLFLILLYSGLGASMAMSMGFRGGARGGGTIRVGASTTFRPGVGVTHSTTLEAGRYHVPAVLPAWRRLPWCRYQDGRRCRNYPQRGVSHRCWL
jgi:hypothetical protein